MRLYDVGFASMVAMEAEALAELAPLAGRAEVVARLRARAATQRGLIAAHLWDAQGGSIHASCMGCRVDVIAHPTPTLAPNPTSARTLSLALTVSLALSLSLSPNPA